MNGVEEMVVIDTKIPDPDGHYRLRRCACGREAEYIRLKEAGVPVWVAACPGCALRSPEYAARHEAQVYWNRNIAPAEPPVRVVPTYGHA